VVDLLHPTDSDGQSTYVDVVATPRSLFAEWEDILQDRRLKSREESLRARSFGGNWPPFADPNSTYWLCGVKDALTSFEGPSKE
jgi:hypothetical protein